MTTEHEIEYTLADGRVVCVRFEAEYSVVDNGIGAYEYWGARGVDKQLDTECDDVFVTEVVDENDDPVSISKEETKAIEQAAYDYAIENCPEVEDCVDDGYDADQERKDRDEWRASRYDY